MFDPPINRAFAATALRHLQNVAHLTLPITVLAIAFISLPVWGRTAPANQSAQCAIDKIAGQVKAKSGKDITISITRNGQPSPTKLPTCVEYGDRLEVGPAITVHVETATEEFDIPRDANPRWDVPPADNPPARSTGQIFAALWHAVTGPREALLIHAASRVGMACPPANGTPPPLAPVQRLAETDQQIGADLRVVVAMWKPTTETRLVRAKLLRADDSVVAQAAGCRGSSLPLPVHADELHPGDRLNLLITDNHGGSLRYNIIVVAPDKLPQPPEQLAQDWLTATWRIAAAGPATNLDSVARVAKASETSFGAQRVLGAVATDTPF
jgi:hypothetical protein